MLYKLHRIYESRSINKLQNVSILLIFQNMTNPKYIFLYGNSLCVSAVF